MANELNLFRGFPSDRDVFGTRALGRLFDDAFTRSGARLTPHVELHDSDEVYLVLAEMPGVPKENIRVETRGNMLYIAGEKRSEVQTKHRYESGEEELRFEQMISLPSDVDDSLIEADFKDGVLYVALPKIESGQTRKIELGSRKEGVFSKMKDKLSKAFTSEKSPKTSEPKSDRAA
jgi:HSP20 family protein